MKYFTSKKLFKALLKLSNLFIFAFAMGFISWVMYENPRSIPLEQFFSMRIKLLNILVFLIYINLWHLILEYYHFYELKKINPFWHNIYNIFKATFFIAFIVGFTGWVFQVEIFSPSFILAFWAIIFLLLNFNQLIVGFGLRIIKNGNNNLSQLLIVGTNRRSIEYAKGIEADPGLGYKLVGFVDDYWKDMQSFKLSNYPLISNFKGLVEFIRAHVVDEVMIFLPIKSNYDQICSIIKVCEEQGIVARMGTIFFNENAKPITVEEIEKLPPIVVSADKTGWQYFVKRGLDIFISLSAIIFLTPLFITIAFLIWKTSPGPILYKQERVGLNKRRFILYKFRTMEKDAENRISDLEHLNEQKGPVFKIKNDPRVIPFGKFLRKTSLDELPQLFNILKGEMSLVGPRPLPIRDFEGFYNDSHRRRFSVLPGITCLWQIQGRNSIPFEKWMELDIEYIDRWSLGLDFKILVKTIPAVIKGSGAT